MTGDPLAFELFNEIGIIDQLAGTIFDRAIPKGMTRAQFTVLNHFIRLGLVEQSPSELASAFQITKPTMTSTLARMERSGLIMIRADPADGRGKRVSLTPHGIAMRQICLDALGPSFPLLDEIISGPELQSLLHGLRRLRIGLDARRDISSGNGKPAGGGGQPVEK